MITIPNVTTATTPSSLGMPACAHAFGPAHESASTGAFTGTFTGTATSWATQGYVVRERQADLVKGDMGIALAFGPGSDAWRPPIS